MQCSPSVFFFNFISIAIETDSLRKGGFFYTKPYINQIHLFEIGEAKNMCFIQYYV